MFISRIRNRVAGFFYFNKQERNGIFLLCLILGLLVIVRLVLPWVLEGKVPVQYITLAPETVEVADKESIVPRKQHQQFSGTKQSEKFVFNPNVVSGEDARRLGFSEKLSATLINFRNKGGKFHKPEDLRKLYGMSPGFYASLESYILIPTTNRVFQPDSAHQKPSYPKKQFPKSLLELNSADSLAIVYLKGIGPAFTKRILKYRSLLGGFHSAGQLKEVYGMNDSIYEVLSSQIVIDKNLITKIPLNAIDLSSLRKHPYLNFQMAQAIVNYRGKHGKLTEADVIKLGVIPEEKLNLLLPYLQY